MIEKKNIDYKDEGITLMRNLSDLSELNHTQLDAYLFLMCRKGCVQFRLNGQEQFVGEHASIICIPNSRIDHLMVGPDANVNVMILSARLVQGLVRTNIEQWNRALYVNKSNMNRLSEEHLRQMGYYYELMESKIQSPDDPYRHEIILTVVRAMLLEILSMIEQGTETVESNEGNTGKMHFKRFLDALQQAKVKKQTVEYYARQLCITPKYLATICNACSQKSAHEWIADMVNEDIRYLLLSTDLSVKEVAQRLGFENASFFGKYVKKHFGCTPMEYRNSHTNSK
jgi:AraC-like DNA-binding protein